MYCPNNDCDFNDEVEPKLFFKDGFFVKNGEKIQRFRCKKCGKKFSSQTFKYSYRQRKPHLNFFSWVYVRVILPVTLMSRLRL